MSLWPPEKEFRPKRRTALLNQQFSWHLGCRKGEKAGSYPRASGIEKGARKLDHSSPWSGWGIYFCNLRKPGEGEENSPSQKASLVPKH
jgi:hypothetical protein